MKRIHFIGLCGIGMSATALLMKENGDEVTGSDAECYGPPVDILARGGLSPILSYTPANIPADVDEFVIGRNAKLSPEENEEVRAAHATGKPIRSFPEVLGELTKNRLNTVVAGSYGKSTTTSLIAHILRYAEVDAGYFIGAEPSRPNRGLMVLAAPSSLGTRPEFILEGDEYPSAHDDPRAKFLHLHPRDVVLTSVVHDHVNIYPTYEGYKKPFAELLSKVPTDGVVVVCADEPQALAMAEASGKEIVTYGVHAGSYHATNIHFGAPTIFTLCQEGVEVAQLETSLLGTHNIEDIVAASAYVLTRKLVTLPQLVQAVALFPGVRRRLDNIAPAGTVPVYEGFGSSYEKARAAIDAMKLHYADRPLVIVFEPHTFGWRNRANLPWYDDVFAGAKSILLTPPPTQGASTHDQLSYEEIAERIRAPGTQVDTYDAHDIDATVEKINPDEVILVLTSGDLEGTIDGFAQAIEKRFPS